MTRPDDLRTLRDAGVLLRRNHDNEVPQWIRAHARRQAERRHGERRMEAVTGSQVREFVAGLAVFAVWLMALWLFVAFAAVL